MENKLDGNAAAGMLQAIFPFDMTLVEASCTGCGTTNAIGATAVYMHGMGMVIRCPLVRHSDHPRSAGQRALLAGYAGRARPADQCRDLALLRHSTWRFVHRRYTGACVPSSIPRKRVWGDSAGPDLAVPLS